MLWECQDCERRLMRRWQPSRVWKNEQGVARGRGSEKVLSGWGAVDSRQGAMCSQGKSSKSGTQDVHLCTFYPSDPREERPSSSKRGSMNRDGSHDAHSCHGQHKANLSNSAVGPVVSVDGLLLRIS